MEHLPYIYQYTCYIILFFQTLSFDLALWLAPVYLLINITGYIILFFTVKLYILYFILDMGDADGTIQSPSDGLIEILGITSSFHIAQLQVGLSQPLKIGQANTVEVSSIIILLFSNYIFY